MTFEFDVQYTPGQVPSNDPDVFAALREQLGSRCGIPTARSTSSSLRQPRTRLRTETQLGTDPSGGSARMAHMRAASGAKDVFQRSVFARVRRLCLALPETAETSSWGHPNFRAGKKTFCTLEIVHGRPSLAFKLSPADVDLLLGRDRFFATPYGRGHWASLWVDGAVNWKLVERLLQRSYRHVATAQMIGSLEARPPQRRSHRERAEVPRSQRKT